MVERKHLITLLLAACFLAACAAPQTPVPAETRPTEETAAATPTLLPTAAPLVDHCLECHTDKDKLTTLAKEEETGHSSESEGVG